MTELYAYLYLDTKIAIDKEACEIGRMLGINQKVRKGYLFSPTIFNAYGQSCKAVTK
jgi:hypothetical protein